MNGVVLSVNTQTEKKKPQNQRLNQRLYHSKTKLPSQAPILPTSVYILKALYIIKKRIRNIWEKYSCITCLMFVLLSSKKYWKNSEKYIPEGQSLIAISWAPCPEERGLE